MTALPIRQNSFRAWLLAARPKTLTGALSPVVLGLALAAAETHFRLAVLPAVLCVLFALVMQIDANFVNDYFDWRRGNDDPATRLGPPRACTMGWVTPAAMRRMLLATTLVACLVGLPLVVFGGWQMLIAGAACVAFCFLYTTALARLGLGDLLVIVFFGIVPVSLTFYLQTGYFSLSTLVLSVACGCVIDNLLIVNNFRDVEIDRADGKRTLAVMIGPGATLLLYFFFGCAATFAVLVIASFELRSAPMLVYLFLHCHAFRRMRRLKGKELNRSLAETARNNLVFAVAASLTALL